MARTLRVALLLGAVQAVQAAVVGHGATRFEAGNVNMAAEMLVARVTNVLHETSPSVLLQKFIKADPKMDKDLPVVHVGPTSDEEIDTLVKQERAAAWKAVGMMATVFAVYVALVALLGWCYSKLWSTPVMSESKPDVEVEDFRHGVFSCFEDMHICALSFCCMPYRWADTMKAAGVMSFWTGVLIFFVVSNLRMWAQDYGPILGLSAWLCSTLIFTYYRQQLRQIFSIKNDTMDKLKDFSLWCCCCCCAAAQEARQVQMKKLDV